MTPLHQNGYGMNAVRNPRDNEYEAFARVTRMMSNAQTEIERITAVHKNNELWTTLAADLANPDNALPRSLRAELASLAIFSIRHGMAVIRRQAQVGALIDINRAILAGLRPEVSR
ncbi:flagellar biosynthesis regulator FlaF (plasmid) [Paracoccus sp. TK19116]|uniref:Flagellar biosynthesis regulator FlaF n=1 Tax=Paracoccus albicereus TaxID=2922394 RepID=A0ABT1MP82_9RHOB|nr:flagellar biosynthesis regulator FlaF [Paracoccus albicereus]MCQ0969228.1 flagellar biosynthesis regulator FlaF [Paracoccus albicereus]